MQEMLQNPTISESHPFLALDSGTVIAAADARYGGTHDAKSKINTAFAKSTDGGKNVGTADIAIEV